MVKPYITRDAVAAALNALVYISTDASNFAGLLRLQLVEQTLTSPDFPPVESPREYAVHSLLSSITTDRLNQLRLLFSLPSVTSGIAPNDIRAMAVREARIANTELIAWSVLYHRYFLTSVTLSFESLAELYNLDDRTCRRYLRYGVKLLTQQLTRLEQAALHEQRILKMRSELPTRGKSPLYGRDELVKQIQRICLTGDLPHILITGISGIGKTSLVEHSVKGIIDQNIVDRLIWIAHCSSVEQVRRMLLASLHIEEAAPSLRPTLAVYKSLIVFDDAAALFSNPTLLGTLLADLADAIVMVICDEFSIVPTTIRHHFRLTGLEFDASARIVRDAMKVGGQNDEVASREIAIDLYNAFGGHPLALRVAATRWDDLDWSALEHDVVRQMLTRTYDRLQPTTQRLWCALALNGRGQCCLSSLENIWGEAFTTADVNALVSHMLIQRETVDCYVMIDAAKLFIRSMYQARADIREIVNTLIATFLDTPSSLCPHILVEIATGDWATPPLDQMKSWLLRTWYDGRESLNAAEWLSLLDFQRRIAGELGHELEIAYAVCLRRLGELDHAALMFASIVSQSGKVGDFKAQAYALIEWSLVTSLRGNYSASEDLLNQAMRSKWAEQDMAFRRQITLMSAQLSVEKRDGKTAFAQLRHLTIDSEVLALLAESCLLVNDIRMALRLAEQSLAGIGENLPLRVRLCTVIGRCRERTNHLDAAQRYLAEALFCAQRLEDRFSIARAQSNLAAVLLERGKFIEAHELLAQAVTVQSRLGDNIGLQTTSHNRQLLERRVAG